MKCHIHTDREAIGTCFKCGRNICKECKVEDALIFVSDSSEIDMSKETDPFLIREIEVRRRASEEYRKKQRYYHCKSCYRDDKEHQEREDEEHQKKNPKIASLLSILCPGAGQAYNGQIGKGIGFLIAYLISWLSGWLTGMDISFALPIILVWSCVDAIQTAKRIKTAKRINKVGEFCPLTPSRTELLGEDLVREEKIEELRIKFNELAEKFYSAKSKEERAKIDAERDRIEKEMDRLRSQLNEF